MSVISDSMETNQIMSVLIQNLRRWIDERDTNPRQLNIKAGLGQTAVNDILNGKSSAPTIVTLAKIAEALNIGLTDLLLPPETAIESRKILALFDVLPMDERQRVVQIAEAFQKPLQPTELEAS
jgi:transcriptional regulator with XRE-family HTH domain